MTNNFDLVSETAKIIIGDFKFTFVLVLPKDLSYSKLSYIGYFGLYTRTTLKIHFCSCFSHKIIKNCTMRENRVNSQHY